MLRRLNTLLLAVTVTLTGLTACPMAGLCCVIAPPTAHDCCRQSATSIRTADCCHVGDQLSLRAVSSQPQTPDPTVPASVDVTVAPEMSLGAAALLGARLDLTHGLAPPGTLTAQHTSLLL